MLTSRSNPPVEVVSLRARLEALLDRSLRLLESDPNNISGGSLALVANIRATLLALDERAAAEAAPAPRRARALPVQCVAETGCIADSERCNTAGECLSPRRRP